MRSKTNMPQQVTAVPKTRPDLTHFYLVHEINRRRAEIANQMDGVRDVSSLSFEALLDILLILNFDEACVAAILVRFSVNQDETRAGV
jgi:hypothetical protein